MFFSTFTVLSLAGVQTSFAISTKQTDSPCVTKGSKTSDGFTAQFSSTSTKANGGDEFLLSSVECWPSSSEGIALIDGATTVSMGSSCSKVTKLGSTADQLCDIALCRNFPVAMDKDDVEDAQFRAADKNHYRCNNQYTSHKGDGEFYSMVLWPRREGGLTILSANCTGQDIIVEADAMKVEFAPDCSKSGQDARIEVLKNMCNYIMYNGIPPLSYDLANQIMAMN